ncbi:MAG TPA: mannose-1-phosphate guanylyltransferase [Symbiobacteriaceae bacterium]|nr:mannose-1-phosphate guanylyltransferase [Symbiobacteriaceae bacterium]
MSTALCVAIMAGGRGLRLWPRSSDRAPKQLRAFFGGPVLLQQSLAAAGALTTPARMYIVTAADLSEPTRTLAGPDVRILTEPRGRDTAACAGLAALHVEREHPGAVLLLLPADHWVGDQAAFVRCLRRAATLAGAHDCVVTLGVRPNRPETGYGYIEVAETDDVYCLRGVRFIEKPDRARAAALAQQSNVLWNAGIYAVRAATLLDLIRRHLPALGDGLARIAGALGSPEQDAATREVYGGLKPISIDHGIAEKLDRFLVVPAEFPWDDLGSWTAFSRVLPPDGAGNLTAGQVRVADASNCLVDTPDLATTLLGVSGLIVVQDGPHLLIAAAERAQDIKRIAEASPEGGS